MKKCKVLFVASSAPMRAGDSTAPFVLNMAKDIADLGCEVHILAPHANGLKAREVVDGVQFYRFKYAYPESAQTLCYAGGVLANINKNIFSYGLIPLFVLSEFVSLIRLMRKNNYDIIHSHWVIPQGVLGCLVSKVFRVPHVISVHGGDIYTFNSFFVRKIKAFALNACSLAIANSRFTKSRIGEIAPRANVKVIPTGSTPFFYTSEEPPKKTERGVYHIIFVGRLVREKGLGFLLRAMKHLYAARIYTLTVVGDGPERNNYQKLVDELGISDVVNFVGAVPHEDVHEFLKRADCFIGPSVSLENGWVEAQGNTFVEALFARIPVIASDIGGIPDAIIDGKTGILVREKDYLALASAIRRLQEDKALSKMLVEEGFNHAHAHFSRFKTAKILHETYLDLVEEDFE